MYTKKLRKVVTSIQNLDVITLVMLALVALLVSYAFNESYRPKPKAGETEDVMKGWRQTTPEDKVGRIFEDLETDDIPLAPELEPDTLGLFFFIF